MPLRIKCESIERWSVFKNLDKKSDHEVDFLVIDVKVRLKRKGKGVVDSWIAKENPI